MSQILAQLWHDGLWLALCMLAVAAVVGVLVGLSVAAERWCTSGLPQRIPGAAKATLDADADRHAHLDAVRSQCIASPVWVGVFLAAREAEVTDLLELALELDDQAPRPTPED